VPKLSNGTTFSDLSVLCAQLTRDLLAIAKFLFSSEILTVLVVHVYSSKQRLITNINCVIITGLEVYLRELLKFGIDKRVVNDNLSVCLCVLIRSN